MAEVAARKAARCDLILQAGGSLRSAVESVSRMVAVTISEKTLIAKVVVFTLFATHEIVLLYICSLLASDVRMKQANVPRQHPLQIGLSLPGAAASRRTDGMAGSGADC